MTDKHRHRRHLVPRGGMSNGMLLVFLLCAIVAARLALSVI
jgi:hypothetical protein